MQGNLSMKNDTDHFNDKVPQELREKLHLIAETIKHDFISDPYKGHSNVEAFACPAISEIYGYHISGFIPSQLGGYEITELYRHDIDSTYHFTNAQTEAANEQERHCYESFWRDFLSDNKRTTDPKLDKNFTYQDLDAYPDVQRKFEEYESEWLEPALLRVQIWVNEKNASSLRIGNDLSFPE